MKKSYITAAAVFLAAPVVVAFLYGVTPKASAAIVDNDISYVNYNKDTLPELFATEDIFGDIDEIERECLALNVYFESRGESLIGQRFVAWVTLNRVLDQRFANTVCGVVWEYKQFSWTFDGKSDIPSDKAAWLEAEEVAREVVEAYGVLRDPTDGATFFHAASTTPHWGNDMTKVVQIDNLVFYKDG